VMLDSRTILHHESRLGRKPQVNLITSWQSKQAVAVLVVHENIFINVRIARCKNCTK